MVVYYQLSERVKGGRRRDERDGYGLLVSACMTIAKTSHHFSPAAAITSICLPSLHLCRRICHATWICNIWWLLQLYRRALLPSASYAFCLLCL